MTYQDFILSVFWKVQRWAAIKQAKENCQICGGVDSLEAHHIRYPKKLGIGAPRTCYYLLSQGKMILGCIDIELDMNPQCFPSDENVPVLAVLCKNCHLMEHRNIDLAKGKYLAWALTFPSFVKEHQYVCPVHNF
jgi:ssDNA-binding Zn-finger/Zn-ribbon topoisomerase 1